MELALLKVPSTGRTWLGLGPFTAFRSQPTEPAFYINDFDLTDPAPWKVPSRWIDAESLIQLIQEAGMDEAPIIHWQTPAPEAFEMTFRRIRRDVLAKRLIKMVPVLTEQGHQLSGHLIALLPNLLKQPGGYAYAHISADSGAMGLTPELLFQASGNQLKTMALAGTAKPGATQAFLQDPKEIDEHEIVVRFLEEQLSAFGKVTRQARSLLEASGLRHFHTPLHLSASSPIAADTLIPILHPTPAVGCLPRTEHWLQRLTEYRHLLDVPTSFGAPFGISDGTQTCMVVTIRGVRWRGEQVYLPTGCGIVGASAFDHEWRELRLKREAIARAMGL
jgi:menaquinone-specific isochorismate synthase